MSENILYTGHFVDDKPALLEQIPPRITGEHARTYATHVTNTFEPTNGIEDITPGRKRILRAIGEVAADGVHAVLVESADGDQISTNKYPHLTIATAQGVKPVESERVIEAAVANGTVMPIEPPIEFTTTEGYNSGSQIITSPPNQPAQVNQLPPTPANSGRVAA